MQMESEIKQVNIDDIIPNRFQPRLSFDDQGLKELADSIKEHGIIQPLVLRKLGNKYEIIAGERRYKASTMAGLSTVPAVISNIDDNKSAEVALVENIQRRDLTPIEEARSYKNLLDKGYLTQEQLAQKMGISQPSIANKLRLLNLSDEVQQALLEGKISERHARSLLVLNNKDQQKEWLNRIISDRMTVRQLDQELKKYAKSTAVTDIPLVDINPNVDDIKNKAIDLNPNKNRNVANMMVPEDVLTDYSEILPASPAPSSLIDNSKPIVETQQPINKFFNTLEESPVNLSSSDQAFSMQNVFDPSFSNQEPTFNNNQSESILPIENMSKPDVEVFGNINNSLNVNQTEPSTIPNSNSINQSINSNNMTNDNSLELNPNNRFFTPASSINSPIVSLDKPTTTSDFDPMALVDLLEPIHTTNDMPIQSIKDVIEKLKNQGIKISFSEQDNISSHQIIINIEK